MFRLGIVGSEENRWPDAASVATACCAIRELCVEYGATTIISGACPRGGVDAWAAEHAHFRGLDLIEHRPRVFAWEGPGGYKERNLLIAHESDRVVSIAPRLYGKWRECYHCKGDGDTPPHVVNGGCWTARRAKKFSIVVVRRNGLYDLVER